MKNRYVILLLIVTATLTNTLTNQMRDQQQFLSPNQIEAHKGICTYKQYNGNMSAINLDDGKQSQSCLITEEQYNRSQIGKKYDYKMVVLDGQVDSIHLEEI